MFPKVTKEIIESSRSEAGRSLDCSSKSLLQRFCDEQPELVLYVHAMALSQPAAYNEIIAACAICYALLKKAVEIQQLE